MNLVAFRHLCSAWPPVPARIIFLLQLPERYLSLGLITWMYVIQYWSSKYNAVPPRVLCSHRTAIKDTIYAALRANQYQQLLET